MGGGASFLDAPPTIRRVILEDRPRAGEGGAYMQFGVVLGTLGVTRVWVEGLVV